MNAPKTKRKEVTLTTEDGESKTYALYRLPYYGPEENGMGGGRELVTQFVPTAAPKIGDYKSNSRLSQIMFKHIAVIDEQGKELFLTTPSLVNNHVPDFKTAITLEKEMMQHNAFFLSDEKLSAGLNALGQMFQQLTLKTLTELAQQSSAPAKQPSMNSEPSTT